MKLPALIASIYLLAAPAAFSQGTINFSNGASGVNAPVFGVNSLSSPFKLEGAGYVVQLYAGPVGTSWNSLTSITPTATFGTGLAAGYFFGGIVTVPNVPTGSPAAYQVRVWTANFATWDTAWAAYQSGNPLAGVGVSGWSLIGLRHRCLPVQTWAVG